MVCGYEIRVNEKIGIDQMLKNVRDKLQNN